MTTAFILIVIHYIADFMFQTEEMALGKSRSFNVLLKHTVVYTLIFYVFFQFWLLYMLYTGVSSYTELGITPKVFLFFPITFVLHTLIDYVSSKIKARKYNNKEYNTRIPNIGFYSMIGLDQVIHYGTLFLTYYFLMK